MKALLLKAGRWRGSILDIIILLLIPLVFIDQFDFGVIFSDTTLTGGDSASWYQVALQLKHELLPGGRLFGWDQQNFFGYPNFQYYFIPPFLLAVLLSYVIPLTISLKLVSVAGIFLTPLVVYWALGKMQYTRPVPVAGAWLSLIFLFHERFTMFGGNALSTFAGEFSYGIAFSLLIAFMGLLHRGIQTNRYLAANALLLALIGLSHAFVFLTAIWLPLYFLLSRRGCEKHLKYVLLLYLFAFLLMAFWVLPMLAQIEYTTPINMIWMFSAPDAFLDAINYEILTMSLLFAALTLALRLPGRHRWLFAYMLGVSAGMYFIATLLKIADIRFFPPLLFFCLLLSIDSAESLLVAAKKHHLLAGGSLLVASMLTAGLWIYDANLDAPAWLRWNYSGYETKPAFMDGTMAELRRCLEHDGIAGRVAWEKAPYNNDFGSDRIFESLPLFTGRNSTEGIHYASAMLSKPITWMHGEYSLSTASPEGIVHPHYDFTIVPARFRMFNITEFIAYTPEIKALASASPAFEHNCDAGDLSVYSIRHGAGGYVTTPRYRPLAVDLVERNWKERYYAWFQHQENLEVPIVSEHFIDEGSSHLFATAAVEIDPRGKMRFRQLTEVPRAEVNTLELSDRSISFKTDSPGQPHVIKVAYSPNWKSASHEPIFPISPGLMLIFPEHENVNLRYQRQWPEIIGILLSIGGIAGIIGLLMGGGLPGWHSSALQFIQKSVCFLRPVLISLLLIGMIAAGLLSYQAKQRVRGDYVDGNRFASNGNKVAAEAAYLKAAGDDNMTRFPQHPDVPNAMIRLARLYASSGRLEEALQQFARLEINYPNWQFIHQVYEETGDILRMQGKHTLAAGYYGRCARLDNTSIAGKRCNDKFRDTGL